MYLRAVAAIALVSLVAFGCGSDSDATPDCNSDMTCGVFELVNQEREAAGESPLVYNGELQLAAQMHAEDMNENGYFSHDSQDGRNFVIRANEAGYSGSPRGENIAAGQTTPEQVMGSWMNSSGHRANILNGQYNEIGVGHAGNLWVQVFGAR